MTNRRTFGYRLREERKRLGLSQAALARAAHVSKNTQIAYEAGTTVPDLEYLDRVTALGVDWTYILSGTRSQLTAIDWSLVGILVGAIQDFATQYDVDIPPDKWVAALKFLYAQAIKEGVVDPDTVESALRLAS